MIPVAILAILVVVVLTVALLLDPDPTTLSIFGATIEANSAGAYLTGAGAMLVLILGIGLLRTGLKRTVRKQRQVRDLKKQAAQGGTEPARQSTSSDTSSNSTLTAEESAEIDALTAEPSDEPGAEPGEHTQTPRD